MDEVDVVSLVDEFRKLSERHTHKACSTESLEQNLLFIMYIVEKPCS